MRRHLSTQTATILSKLLLIFVMFTFGCGNPEQVGYDEPLNDYLTAAQREDALCGEVHNNACPDGTRGRICETFSEKWCEVWSCGSDGCRWVYRQQIPSVDASNVVGFIHVHDTYKTHPNCVFFDNGEYSCGTRTNLSKINDEQDGGRNYFYKIHSGYSYDDIVGMIHNQSDGCIYYNDGYFACERLDMYKPWDWRIHYAPKRPYQVAAGKSPDMIVGLGSDLRYNNRVYAWYSDGEVSGGKKDELDYARKSRPFSLPSKIPGVTVSSILGMGSHEYHNYTWYKEGYVSNGKTIDLDAYNGGRIHRYRF